MIKRILLALLSAAIAAQAYGAGTTGVTLNTGTGGANLGTDNDSVYNYEIIKVGFGLSGATPTQVSSTNPFPVTFTMPALVAGSATIGAVTQASGPWTMNLTQVNGSTVSLGQAVAANSIPTVLPSVQITTLTPPTIAQGSTTSGESGFLHLCAVTTSAPSDTTAQSAACSITLAGSMRMDLSSEAGTAVTSTPTAYGTAPSGNVIGANVYVTGGTVAAVTADNLAYTTATDIASAAITTTTTSSAITLTGYTVATFGQAVTAVSGTTPTLKTVVQWSSDNTNWQDLYHFATVSTTGYETSPAIRIPGLYIRYVRTITGTTPSFTMSMVRNEGSVQPNQAPRKFFDTSIVPTTLSSTTAAYNVEGCENFVVGVSSGAATTPATFQVQTSPDNVQWFSIGTATASVASTNTVIYSGVTVAKFIRVIVTAAGTGQTLNYVIIQAN